MTIIYKYRIAIERDQKLDMPETRKFLHAGLDANNQPCIWALVDTESRTAPAYINVVGTGHELGLDFFGRSHIGTFLKDVYVWHVFA